MRNSFQKWAIADACRKGTDIVDALELGLAICLDRTTRAVNRLAPRTYSQQRRVLAVTPGQEARNSPKVAIFVVYYHDELPRFSERFITAAARNDYNVVVVSNVPLRPDQRNGLIGQCSLLIERANVGRDFGAYKDAISLVFDHFARIDRLILANDSVYYLPEHLDDLFAKLSGPDDFIGVSEVHEHHYHVASFLLSFGPGLLNHPAFREFWRTYRPLESRMWIIMAGEGALTEKILEAGFRPLILYRAEALFEGLRALAESSLDDCLALFPCAIRGDLRAVSRPVPDAARTVLAEQAVRAILARNQMHAGGFAFKKILGMPFFKRDIVYRELYSTQEVERLIDDLDPPTREEIIVDLARRCAPRHTQLLRRLLFRHGYL